MTPPPPRHPAGRPLAGGPLAGGPVPGGPLTEAQLAAGVGELVRHDPVLATVVVRYGQPPMWAREPGFPALLRIMLEQQVSLASAAATFDRLCASVDPLTAGAFLRLDDVALRAMGFSRQKARYGRAIATAVVEGRLDLDALAGLDDEDVDAALCTIPGIGPWTASIYRLMALRRPDAWPAGDLAVALAIAELWQLPAPPTPDEMRARAEAWRPWRSVAARLLWHHYLSARSERRGARRVR